MNIPLFQKLHGEGLISSSSMLNVGASKRLISLHWEFRTVLYIGILLLTAGLGILVYKNIDTIGHQAILLFIALITAGCFYYCFKNKMPYSNEKVNSPNTVFDYILLLGRLTFIIFIAYFQYQYNIFGERYGLATFFPMVVLFATAYYFDHLGILSMAITNLGAWVGITVTLTSILRSNDFNSHTIILTAIGLGICLVLLSKVSVVKRIKPHFEFTYLNFAMHILFIAMLAAMGVFERIYLICFLLLLGVSWFFYQTAKKHRSFFILLMTTLYSYIALNYVIIRLITLFNLEMAAIYLGFIYFIASGIGLVMFLMRTNKKFKA